MRPSGPIRRFGLVLLTPMLAAIPLSAQAVLEFNHANESARLRLSDADTGIVVTKGAALRRNWPEKISVRVINGNTALYSYKVESGPVVVPEVAKSGLTEFLKKIGPYIPEVALAVSGPMGPGRSRGDATVYRSLLPDAVPAGASERVRDAWVAGRSTEQALAVLDERLFGPSGLHQLTATVLSTLELMRSGGDVAALSLALSDSLALAEKGCQLKPRPERVPLTSDLLSALQNVLRTRSGLTRAAAVASAELSTFASQHPFRDSLLRIITLADTAAADYQNIVAAAYAFERVALPVSHACATFEVTKVDIKDLDRRSVQLKVESRPEPELARVANRRASTFAIVLEAAPLYLMSFGASLLVAPRATFPVIGTRSATGGVEIFESGVRDARYNWGVTFGIGWRTNITLAKQNVRFWLPEITLPPSTDVKMLGLGSALSFGVPKLGSLKLGAGAVWVRHTQLLGQHIGSVIPSKDHLKSSEAYGSPKLYLSLSIFDVPPFTTIGK